VGRRGILGIGRREDRVNIAENSSIVNTMVMGSLRLEKARNKANRESTKNPEGHREEL
jgi:hypothetical protein